MDRQSVNITQLKCPTQSWGQLTVRTPQTIAQLGIAALLLWTRPVFCQPLRQRVAFTFTDLVVEWPMNMTAPCAACNEGVTIGARVRHVKRRASLSDSAVNRLGRIER